MKRLFMLLAAAAVIIPSADVKAMNFSKVPSRSELKVDRSHRAVKKQADAPITPIITKPEGETLLYNKTSFGTFVMGNSLYMYTEDFPAEVTWGKDGDVYFKNLVSVFPDDYYLKGKLEGNTITMPCNQTIEYIEEDDYGINFGVFKTEISVENGVEMIDFEYAPEIENISFTVEEDGSMKMVLPGQPFDGENVPEYIVGFYYTDDYSFLGYSDFFQEYTKLALQQVRIPEGADVKQYVYIDDYNYASIVDVAFVGDDLYIRGLSSMLPEGTIKAKVDGNKAFVAQDQYLGVYYDMYYIFTKVLYANPDYDEENPDSGDPVIFAPSDAAFELNIDSDGKTIYADREDVYLSFHCDAEDFLNSLGFFDVFTLTYQESFAGIPANPVSLEYHTEWASQQGFNDFFFTLSNFSTEGTLLDVEKLYYKVFVNGEPMAFREHEQENLLDQDVTVYSGVPVEVELLPYLFNNNEDIFKFSDNAFDIGIYREDVETIGVQAVYYLDDIFTYSDIVTLNVETGEVTTESSTVSSLEDDGNVVSTEYYTLDGRKVKNPDRGIYIRVDRTSGGMLKVKKEAL